jgi:DNA-binding SARP family transcriptional activator
MAPSSENFMTFFNLPSIRVLGPTRIGISEGVAGGQGLPTVLQRVLWVLVASNPAESSAERLASVVWEDRAPTNWNSALRTHVVRLRRILEDANTNFTIDHNRSGYFLVGDQSNVDIYRFRSLIEEAKSANSAGQQKNLLTQAAELWLGEPFEDVADGQLRALADRLCGLFAEATKTRRVLAVELGESASVIRELEFAAAEDPTDIALVEPLAAAYLAIDNRDAAQRLLRRHRESLESVGFEPGVGLAALERRLLVRMLQDSALQARLFDIPIGLDSQMFPFGREPEVAQFQEALASGSTSYFFLHGPPGMGKSCLVAEFGRHCKRQGIPVLAAWAEEHSPPYQPISDLLRPWAENIYGANLETLETVLASIVDVTPSGRALVIIEDLHFADLATIKLIRRLLKREPIDGVAFVFTVRDGARGSSVEQLFDEIRRLSISKTIQVGPVAREAIFDLIRHHSSGPSHGLVQGNMTAEKGPVVAESWTRSGRLLRSSAGVPVVLRLLLANDAIELSQIPLDTEELVEQAVLRLEPGDADILAVGALLVGNFDVSIVAETYAMSIARVLDAVDRAAKVGICDRRIGTRVKFGHELIRQALKSQQSEVWRCRYHLAIATVLERREADPFRVACHRASALVDETSTQVLEQVLNRVSILQSINRWEESLTLLEIVQPSLLEQPWCFEAKHLFDFYVQFGRAHDGCADSIASRSYFRLAIEVAEKESNAAWIFDVAIASAGSSQPLNGDVERVSWLQRAFDAATGLDKNLRVEALAEFVYLKALDSVDAPVVSAVNELVALAEEVGTDRARGFAAHGLLAASLHDSDPFSRIERAENAHSWAHSVPPEIGVTPHLVKIASLLQLGRMKETLTELVTVEEFADKRQRPGDRWVLHILRAVLDEWTGDDISADRYARMAKNLAVRHEIHGGREAWGLFHIARAIRGSDPTALQRFVAVSDPIDFPSAALTALHMARIGELKPSRLVLRRVVPHLSEGASSLGWLGTMLVAGEAASLSAPEFAGTLEELLVPYAGLAAINGLVSTSTFGPVDRVLSMLAFAGGDEAKAHLYGQRATAFCLRSGLAGWNKSILPQL